ncbi:MAG TPA: LysE family translocator [Chitinophagaceae bacterium]|jgi:RhtB (resistance to homoserine/threonine) family protein|nr:LysE family translocator [Chitinophagaceae bacterium]
MFRIEHFYLFLSVSILINISPGPDMLYTAARSLSQGTKAGILSTLGIFTGCLFHIAAAVFGLSKIIQESILLFSIIKYAGAAYLIYLGLKSFIKRKKKETGITKLQPMTYQKIFLQGMITNLLNPKVAIFFLSFLPQFIDPQSHYVKEQIAFLGLWFNVQGCIILATVASVTGFFRHLLLHNKTFWNWQEKITGAILVGLGIRMFFSKK